MTILFLLTAGYRPFPGLTAHTRQSTDIPAASTSAQANPGEGDGLAPEDGVGVGQAVGFAVADGAGVDVEAGTDVGVAVGFAGVPVGDGEVVAVGLAGVPVGVGEAVGVGAPCTVRCPGTTPALIGLPPSESSSCTPTLRSVGPALSPRTVIVARRTPVEPFCTWSFRSTPVILTLPAGRLVLTWWSTAHGGKSTPVITAVPTVATDMSSP